MDFDQLLAFERVAREGSFSRAALAVGIGQPAMSARIHALEAALGGAKGYVVKGASVKDLLGAIKVVGMGGFWVDPSLPPTAFRLFLERRKNRDGKIGKLSRRELQILSHVAEQMSNRDIGSRLHIDKRTVKNHLTHIFMKLGVTNREQAAQHLFQ